MVERINNYQASAIRQLDFDQPVINIGSHPDNDVVISGNEVLPFHASIFRQDDSFCIMPLSPDAKISLEGKPLQADTCKIGENQLVEIGGNSLYLQNGLTPTSLQLSLFKGAEKQEVHLEQATSDGEQSILVNIISQQSTVEASQTAVYEFEIVNAGRIVASFQTSIQGVPSDWVQITPRIVNLNEGQRTNIQVSITPPRLSSSKAGKHPINLVVTSPNYPRSRSVTKTDLTILPFYEFSLGNLSPRQQHIHWKQRTGRVNLPLNNQGNSPTNFSVMALDEENGCSFDFEVNQEVRLTRQAEISVDAGESYSIPIDITPNRQRLISFRNKQYHYSTTVQITGQAVTPQTVSGSVVHHPLLGWWAILLSALMVLTGIFLLIQPNIRSFDVSTGKDVIAQGDTTNLEWSVSPFATRISITNVDKDITRSMNHIAVAPTASTTYELTAGNWLSGLLGMDRTKSIAVLVVPPTPSISVFEVDKTSVDKGNPITIRWSVTNAEKVILTIDKVVYELTADQFSGERTVTLDKDALVTLEAKNLSGSELQSHFIKVVPPEITINKFIVWVKPESSSVALNLSNSPSSHGPALLMPAKSQTSDSDFSEKFVELVPDDTAENGYKVMFYQPDRELDKGEQVMVEWSVDGVNSLSIAPFTDVLPSSGKQPFFPQESMNFVLTAKNGDLDQIFMLPVTVFDGVAPTAPKIDFFKAVPTKMTGSGNVQFSWSVSGEWTNIELTKSGDSSEEVIAKAVNPIGFKKVAVTESSTFLLKAYNGTLSTATPVDITVDPSLIAIALNINNVYTDAGRFMVGQKVLVTVGFTGIPTSSPKPSGTVTVTDGFSSCTITLPALSCNLTFLTPGKKSITSSYSGDSIYLQDDSPAYSKSITVESAEVEMVPRYYNLTDGSVITDITDSTNNLDMNQGLRIVVELQPKNVSIPDDEKSKVTVSICDQDANGDLVDGSCKFIGGATAAVATDADKTFDRVPGSFYANISVPRFLVSGKHLLLFNYAHDDNAIDPSSVEQPNVTIGKVKFHLSASICTTDADALTGCKLGAADPTNTEVVFTFRTSDPNADLSATLPAPLASNFVISATGTSSTGTTPTTGPWDCKVENVSGVYKLICTVKGMDSQYNNWHVTYQFSDTAGTSSYLLDPNAATSFDMEVLGTTKIVFKDIGSVKVGQEILLTDNDSNGLVTIQNSAGNRVTSKDSLIITESNGNSLSTIACTSTTNNCTQDETTGAITIATASTDSSIVIKKVGDISLTATYAGDSVNYLSSTGTTKITAVQQSSITTTWQYTTNASASPVVYSSWPTQLSVNTVMHARIVLGISDSSATFDSKSLAGRIMTLKFLDSSGVSNCSVGTTSSGTAGEYLLSINYDATTSAPVADFTITCGSTNGTLPFVTNLQLEFANVGDTGTEGDDLAFSSSATIKEDLTVANNSTISLTSSIVRAPITATGHDNLIPTSGSAVTFNVGEKYAFQFSTSELYGFYNNWGAKYTSNSEILSDYVNSDNYVNITLPPSVENAIDWTQSTCGVQNNVRTRLNQFEIVSQDNESSRSWNWGGAHWNHWYWGDVSFRLKSAPCYLVFKSDTTINQNLTFSYTSHNNIYTTTQSYTTYGIAKQDVSLALDPATIPASIYVGDSQVIKINLSSSTLSDTVLPFIDPSVTSFDKQFSVITSCGTISDQKINSTTQAQFTLNSKCASEQVTINYVQNTYFKALTDQKYTFTFTKHTSAQSLEYKNGSTWPSTPVAFPFSTTNQANTATSYTFRVKVANGDSSQTVIPTGQVKVKATDGTYTITGGTLNSDGYYYITLDSNGYAEFSISFSAPVSNVKLQYLYSGSDYFAAPSAVSETAEFNVVEASTPITAVFKKWSKNC